VLRAFPDDPALPARAARARAEGQFLLVPGLIASKPGVPHPSPVATG